MIERAIVTGELAVHDGLAQPVRRFGITPAAGQGAVERREGEDDAADEAHPAPWRPG